jgi:phage terminase small subunit
VAKPANNSDRKPSVDVFIKEYVLGGLNNARQAAIKAGYSEKTADQQASRLLKNVKVKDAIEKHKKKADKAFIWSKEKKLQLLEQIALCATTADAEKGMINMQSAIAALKEHNLMMGDNAPTVTENTHVVKSFTDMYGDS